MKVETVFRWANIAMLLIGLAFIASVVVAYGFESSLPMMFIALLHVAQMILAGLFKVSYVVRLVSQKQLGLKVA